MKSAALKLFLFCLVSLRCIETSGQGLILDQSTYELTYAAPFVNREFTALPRVVSLKIYCPKAQKQSIPACVGYTLAYAASIRRNIKENTTTDDLKQLNFFAPLFVYNQAISSDEGCNRGTSFKRVFEVAKTMGLDEYSYWENRNCRDMPDSIALSRAQLYKLSGAETIRGYDDPSLLLNIKAQLYSKNPVLVGLKLNAKAFLNLQTAASPSTLAYSPQHGKDSLLHAVTIIGYDDDLASFECMNSYGDKWGNKGFFNIRYEDFVFAHKEAYFITGDQYRASAEELPAVIQALMQKQPKTKETNLGGSFELLLRGIPMKPELSGLEYRHIDVEALDRLGHYRYPQGIRNGEEIQFVFGSETPAFIYLLNRSSSGRIQVLFPNETANPPQSAYFPYQGALTTFPQQPARLTLDGAAGMEYIYLLMSNVPLNLPQIVNRLQQRTSGANWHLSSLKEAVNPYHLATGFDLKLASNRVQVSATATDSFVVPIVISIPHY